MATHTPSSQDLSIIIPASNEESTIGPVLQEVEQLHPKEIIVVVNGSQDNTLKIVTDRHHKYLEFPERLGHDVGRSLGASVATGDILLFVDADIVIPWTELEPFVNAIKSGYDVALNDIDTIVNRYPWDPVSVQKIWLNVCLNRRSLQTASLTAVPHALSRNVFRYITPDDLSVPPRAYTKLLVTDVRVTKAHSVDVVTTNKIHAWHGAHNGRNMMAELIIGDHLEALDWLRTHTENQAARHQEDDATVNHTAHGSKNVAPSEDVLQSPPRPPLAGTSILRAFNYLWHWLTQT